jgi:hypothetical protein
LNTEVDLLPDEVAAILPFQFESVLMPVDEALQVVTFCVLHVRVAAVPVATLVGLTERFTTAVRPLGALPPHVSRAELQVGFVDEERLEGLKLIHPTTSEPHA